jgi:hypothetical protein
MKRTNLWLLALSFLAFLSAVPSKAVPPAPNIDCGPALVNACVGDSVPFVVNANSTAPLGILTGGPYTLDINIWSNNVLVAVISAPATPETTPPILGTTPWVATATYLVTGPGTYTATATDFFGSSDACTRVFNFFPQPSVSVVSDYDCLTQTATLTATATGGTVVWYVGSLQVGTGSTLNVNTTADYTAVVTSPGGCTAMKTLHVGIFPAPSVSVVPQYNCLDQTSTLTATFSGGDLKWTDGSNTDLGSNPVLVVSATGDYTATVTSPAGCVVTKKVHVDIFPAPSVSVAPQYNCLNQTSTLTATFSGGTLKWTDGSNTDLGSNPVLVVSASGDYTATVTSPAGCVATKTVHVDIFPAPTVSVTGKNICTGETATLTAIYTGGTVKWYKGNVEVGSGPTLNVTMTGDYTATVTSPAGCTKSATAHVEVYPKPTVTVNSTTSCPSSPVVLTATASVGVTFLWNTGDTTASITVSPTVTTSYTVVVKNSGGCTATNTGTVTVTPGACDPGSFNFAGNTASTGAANVRTYTTANGVNVKVTGFSRSSTGVWAPGFVGAYAGGLGITDVNEDGTAPSHTVDNVGNDNYLLFEFSQSVVIKQAMLGYVTTDSDLTLKIGTFADPYNNHLVLNDSVLASFGYTEQNAGAGSVRTAVLNSGGLAGNAVIIAASLTDKTYADQFKVQTLDICKPACFQPVTVGDFVWNDLNKNGIQDAGEPGINGVTLTLSGTSASGVSVTGTATTAGNGGYLFAGLEPGTYTVTINAANFAIGGALAGFTASPTVVGANRAIDSNVYPAGTTPTSLPGGSSDLTLDFGFFVSPPPPVCVATTFYFDGTSGTDGADGNTRLYTVNGVSVRASAWSRDKATGVWAKGWLGAYAGGLGVTDTSEGTGADNSHTVDNIGRDNYVVFEFSQKVVVNRAFLGYVVGDSDLLAAIGTVANAYTSPQTLSDAYFNTFDIEENDTTLTTTRWADFNSANTPGNVLVIGASPYDDTPDDMFKIQKLDICAPPTPPPPQECVSTTFPLSGNSALSGTVGNIRTFTVNGISVKASAFSRTTAGVWTKAYLGSYGGGLGVTDGSEGDGSGNRHTVDNVDQVNYILFEFSQPVIVNRAYLGYVVGDSDLSAWIGTASNPYVNHLNLSDALLTGFGAREDNDTTLTTTRWADINAANKAGNVLVVAASLSDTTPDDYFKVEKLDVCAGPPPPCPSPWVSKDIGNCTMAGFSSAIGGLYTLKGSGDDIWNTADAFRFVYQTGSGDCSVIARVTSINAADPWAKVGVMIRETLNANSEHASLFVTSGNGVAFQARTVTGGGSVNTAGAAAGAPYWVKITRVGNTFTSYQSANGSTWAAVGSTTITMPTTVYIGLAVTSHNNAVLATGTFDNITATP